jgi:hypothetical protein
MVRELGLLQLKKTCRGLFQCKREFNYHNINETNYYCKTHASIEEGSKGRAE